MRISLFSLSLIGLLPALPVLANDGFGGIAATGLQFGQTDAVAMQDEDLYISPTEIRVAYVFHNETDQDVTGEVIFPLPPIGIADTMYSEWNLPEDRNRANLVDFHATVDGKEVPVMIDRVAVIEPEWSETTPVSQQYDTPGKDVTDLLAEYHLPLSVDATLVSTALLALDATDRQKLVDLGLAEYDPGGDGYEETAFPLWSVVLRYHWTQTFPAGADLKISHSYENRPGGGLFPWQNPPEDYMQDTVNRYCIDAATSKALVKRLTYEMDGETQVMGSSYEMAYVLRTANSWAGPIGHFRLTIDKAAEKNIVSLCADGIKKTGPTTFVMEKTDFTPQDDLRILVVQPIEY
jgi:hypothetical protein